MKTTISLQPLGLYKPCVWTVELALRSGSTVASEVQLRRGYC